MRPPITQLIIATHNKGKVREINELLKPFNIKVFSAIDLELDEPEETEDSFIGNSILKAKAAAFKANMPALADDSGLCVHALDNAPGIYSARWAGEAKDFNMAMDRIKNELIQKNADDYSAHFVCALALVYPDENIEPIVFEGKVYGQLSFPPKGDKGFGYDPIFTLDGEDETFGQMDQNKKHAISHRAKAFDLLVDYVFKNNG